MIESLVILTTVFGAYIVHTIISDGKTASANQDTEPENTGSEPPPAAETVPEETTAQKVATETAPEEPVAEQAVSEPAPAEPVVEQATSEPAPSISEDEPAPEAAKQGLKNPKTGEVVINYNNYRFLKRWIKEALVAEGLLDKIYKNNELNSATEAKVKEALAQLECIDKYKA